LNPFKNLSERLKESNFPSWFSVDTGDLKIKIQREPEREDIEVPVDVPEVIEFYSR
jgi:ribosomal protein S4